MLRQLFLKSRKINLTEDFIRQNKESLDWVKLCREQRFSEKFLEEMVEFVHFQTISRTHIISDQFFNKHAERFPSYILAELYFKEETLLKHFMRSPWDKILEIRNLSCSTLRSLAQVRPDLRSNINYSCKQKITTKFIEENFEWMEVSQSIIDNIVHIDFNIFCKIIWKKNMPASLLSALEKKKLNASFLVICQMVEVYKGLVPLERLVEFVEKFYLSDYTFSYLSFGKLAMFKKILLRYNNKRRVKFLFSTYEQYSYIEDLTYQFYAIGEEIVLPQKPKDLKEIHDYVSFAYRKRGQENFDLDIKSHLLKYVDQEEEEFSVVVPKDFFTLIDWGAILNNCIASYGDKCLFGKVAVLGIFVNKRLTFVVEVVNCKITQVGGVNNKRICEEVSAQLKNRLSLLGYIY